MSSDDSFRGMVSVTVIEATGLKPVTRPGGSVLTVDNMNPYAVIDFDDFYFGKTNSRKGTSNPIWGEIIEESVEDAQRMQITLFSASSIPPDTFLAHVMIQTSELRSFTRQGFDEHEVRRQRASLCESACVAWNELSRNFAAFGTISDHPVCEYTCE